MVLALHRSIQHAKDFENIAIALVAMKLVAGAVKAQHQFSRAAAAGLAGGIVVRVHCDSSNKKICCYGLTIESLYDSTHLSPRRWASIYPA